MSFNYQALKNFAKPYVIAEIGANHNGDMDLCRKLVRSAKEAGADCAKFQSWSKKSLWAKEVYQSSEQLEREIETYQTQPDQLREMSDYCREIGIDFACTPFMPDETDLLVDELKVPFLKVASMDVDNLPFLKYLASKRVPIVLSTGMATFSEIARALETLTDAGERRIVLLHCVSNYPPRDEDVNLRNIELFAAAFPFPVGFSDHTLGTVIPLAAGVMGACVIEKHFTLDKTLPGWDHAVSADVADMTRLVEDLARIDRARGARERTPCEAEMKMKPLFRRSIVSARSIEKGDLIQAEDLVFKRPGNGLPPHLFDHVVGRRAARNVEEDRLLQLEDFG